MRRPTTTAIIIAGVLAISYGVVREVHNHQPIVAIALGSVASQMITSGAAKDALPSIDTPRFDSVKTADAYLSDDGSGIDLSLNGEHRFYPYQILVWHQIVNDDVGGKKIVVTYDPLCALSRVFDREINGTTYDFGNSGEVYNNNLVIFDRQTNSLWSQALGKSVDGSLNNTTLSVESSSVMTWSAWKVAYPNGEVLSRSTGAIRDYTSNPYGDYAHNKDIYFPMSSLDVSRPLKDTVAGSDGESMYWFCFAAFHPGEPVTK